MVEDLIIKKENDLSSEQILFLSLHNKIVQSGTIICNSIVNLAQHLKTMLDEKLFKAGGYSSFEDYTEKACGLKRSTAYQYIQILDNLGAEFVQTSGQIGISKLSLLSSLSNEERKAVKDNIDIESSTVKELKQEIANLKLQSKDFAKFKEEKESLTKTIEDLKTQIAVFESQEPEIKEVEIIKDDSSEYKQKINEYKQKLIKAQDDLKQKELALDKLKEQQSLSNKQQEFNNSKELLEFKILFENLQNNIAKINLIIPKLPEDKKEGCKNALKKVVEVLC